MIEFLAHVMIMACQDASPLWEGESHLDAQIGLGGQVNVISVAVDGGGANGACSDPYISDDGKVVSFISSATNLVRSDTNAQSDLFVRDISTGITVLASDRKGQSLGACRGGRVSPDGSCVVFALERDSPMKAGDASGDLLYRRRLSAQEPSLLVDSTTFDTRGQLTLGIVVSSSDASVLAFEARLMGATNGDSQVYLLTSKASVPRLISCTADGRPANGYSFGPVVSRDGARVAFLTNATELTGCKSGLQYQVAIYDVSAGKSTVIGDVLDCASSNGSPDSLSMAANGSRLIFQTYRDDADGPGGFFSKIEMFSVTGSTITSVTGKQRIGGLPFEAYHPGICGNGTTAAFYVEAGKVLPGHEGVTGFLAVCEIDSNDIAALIPVCKGDERFPLGLTVSMSADGYSAVFQSQCWPGDKIVGNSGRFDVMHWARK